MRACPVVVEVSQIMDSQVNGQKAKSPNKLPLSQIPRKIPRVIRSLEQGFRNLAWWTRWGHRPHMEYYEKFLLGKLTRIPGVTGVHSSFELRRVVQKTALPLEHIHQL